jgi:acyl carrier protein
MRTTLDELVGSVVARHLDISPAAITPSTDLERDLHLDPLDLVLIALRIEELEGREFPIARLEQARSVADLTRIVRAMRASAPAASEFTLDARLPRLATGS